MARRVSLAVTQGLSLLASPDPRVRADAGRLLAAVGEEGIAALCETAHGEDAGLSVAAALALIDLDHPMRLRWLAGLLYAPNPLVGDLAARALAREGERAVSLLIEALAESHLWVRLAIVRALESIGSRRAVTPLVSLLAADCPTLCYTVIEALGALGDPAAIGPIRAFAGHPDHHVRARVQRALDRLETLSGSEVSL